MNTFWVESAVSSENNESEDEQSEEEQEIIPVQSNLSFVKAKNSTKEVTNGKISFLFFPDGTKEFGMLLVIDPETGDAYTLFINPYLSSPEIKGETYFEEYSSF